MSVFDDVPQLDPSEPPPKVVFAIENRGDYSVSGFKGNVLNDLPILELRVLQDTLLDAALDLERAIKARTKGQPKQRMEIHLPSPIVVSVTEEEWDDDTKPPILGRLLVLADDCELVLDHREVEGDEGAENDDAEEGDGEDAE